MLSSRLEKLRTERKMTRKEVAEFLKIDQSTYGKYELGKREPDFDTISRLADLFDCTTDYLIGRTDSRNAAPSPDNEIEEILEALHKRPEMKTLFSISKRATKDDIEKTVKIIEALKEE